MPSTKRTRKDASSAGMVMGMVTLNSVCSGLAPREAAASKCDGSMFSNMPLILR